MTAIRTDNLSKRFGEITAVDCLNLTIEKGELFGLVGSDGAGKTTTIRMLVGIMDPSDGEAWVNGHHTVREADPLKDDIGYMSQRFALYPDLTVIENLLFYADIHGLSRKERDPRIDRLLGFSNLAPFRNRPAGKLSGGMKQKLGLSCALIHTPKVLFLDEPTNGVDPVSRRDFWRILHQLLREGVTIFVATSYLDEADRCNRVGLIHDSRLLACDRPERLRDRMSGEILEVRSSNARKSAAILRERILDASVGIFGDRLHLVSRSPEQHAELASSILNNEGIGVMGIRRIEPSLEDVYISILSANSRELAHDPN